MLDAVTCGPLGTPRARGDALRRETLVFPGGVAWGLARPALRATCAEFLLACARRDAERAGPAVRVVAEAVARCRRFPRSTCLRAATDPASRRLRALVATFGPAAPSYTTILRRRGVGEMEIKYLREAVERASAESSTEPKGSKRAIRRAARLNTRPRVLRARLGGALRLAPRGRLRRRRSCFRGSSPALAAPRWPAAAASSGDEPAPPPAKRARRGEGPYGPSLDEVESLCAGRMEGASSIDRARGRGDALAEDFALELLDDDRPPLDGVDFYRVGGSTVVLNADARWKDLRSM